MWCTFASFSYNPTPDPDPSDNTATVAEGAVQADVGVVKSASPPTFRVGQSLDYTMSVTNHGPSRADGVRLIDPLPAGMAFVSVTTNKGTCAGGTIVTCDLGDLDVGAGATVTVVATATAAGELPNTASVSLAGLGASDSNPANDSSTATVTAGAAPPPPPPPPPPRLRLRRLRLLRLLRRPRLLPASASYRHVRRPERRRQAACGSEAPARRSALRHGERQEGLLASPERASRRTVTPPRPAVGRGDSHRPRGEQGAAAAVTSCPLDVREAREEEASDVALLLNELYRDLYGADEFRSQDVASWIRDPEVRDARRGRRSRPRRLGRCRPGPRLADVVA